jgi:hypothetical protein
VRLDEITDRQEPGSVVQLAIVAGLEDLDGSTERVEQPREACDG